MVRLIMGANGAGKTKQLIELIHNSVEAYKKNMFALLGKPGYEELRETLLAKLGR